MKKLLLLLFTILLLSCNNNKVEKIKTTDGSLLVNIQVDTAKYEEIRYVNARHFTTSNLYGIHCKLCHGVDGTGDGPIARSHKDEYCPLDLSKVTKPDKEVYYVILNGTEHMPNATKPVAKHILTNDDIWLVVFYIKKFRENEK